MKTSILAARIVVVTALVTLMVGCQSSSTQTAGSAALSAPASQPMVAPAMVPIANPVATASSVAKTEIRIKAGAAEAFKDSAGNVWSPDQGFSGGDTIERADLSIGNTTEPGIYRSEHYSMDSFSCPLPNGKYMVKLHFCETYDGIDGPGQRVFSFNVQGREFKDFDVWVKAGGGLKAYVESVPVEIKNGNLKITFTSNVENPQINGIEIIPQS